MKIVGASAKRVDGFDKVTGAAKFAVDLVIPGAVHGKILRSPYPHARIVSIHTTEADRVPGVLAVLTGKDLSDIQPYFGRSEFLNAPPDHPIIAIDRVLYAGEPVAAVAARDGAAAEEALSKIEVEYEPLPAASTVAEATAPGAPQLHSFASNNICFHDHVERGDVENGFAEADLILEDTFEFPMVYHYSMEPHTTIAQFDSDGITVWSSSAHPFIMRQQIAEIFRCPVFRVRVIIPFVGGAYGSKSGAKIDPLVVALARKARRPVRVTQSVSEAMMTVRRHAATCKIKTGVKKDGRLVAKRAELFLNTGAYAENGPIVTSKAMIRVLGPYRIPHIKIDAYCVYTHTVPAASFRSIGAPQSAWAAESQMDMMAEKLGIDPMELRFKNLLKRGEEIRPKGTPLDADLFEGLHKVKEALRWDGPISRDGKGRGVSFGVTDAGSPLASIATVHLDADGNAVLLCGTSEIGQGARTIMSQIVAEELCLPLERVTMRPTDTMYTPYDRSTGSSRSTTVMGRAVQEAAQDAREQLLRIASRSFEIPPQQIRLDDGNVLVGDRKISYGELIGRHFATGGGEVIGRGSLEKMRSEPARNPLFWEIGIGAVEIDVDEETGRIGIAKYVTAADVGKAINPMQCEGQDEGSAMMGVGHTLYESIIYDNGQIVNPNLIDYRVPAFEDTPKEFECILVENGDGPGPYGAKGMGEAGIIPPAAAIANALAWKTGARIKELPLTPERVWRALRDKRKP
ncbi:MAG: xanthine dehydrogenase family protein [Deltaproteobacteria bacterium]|nr:xanthine dehydrogenase family protein [Deltaproteobacteria bacterium]